MTAANDNGERWLPVVGFEGRYEVSDLGRVRSLRFRGNGGPQVMRTTTNHNGYHVITLGFERKQFRVPRLVLAAFVGPCPRGMEVCHAPDFSKNNNRLDNLRWDTTKANCEERDSAVGVRNFKCKLTDAQAREVAWRCRSRENQNKLAAEFGITSARVSQLGRDERYCLRA